MSRVLFNTQSKNWIGRNVKKTVTADNMKTVHSEIFRKFLFYVISLTFGQMLLLDIFTPSYICKPPLNFTLISE